MKIFNPSFKNQHLTLNGTTLKVKQEWILKNFGAIGYQIKDLIAVGPFKYIKVEKNWGDFDTFWYSRSKFKSLVSHCKYSPKEPLRYLNRDLKYNRQDGALQSVSLLNILRALSVAHATIWRPILMVVVIAGAAAGLSLLLLRLTS